ncbi:MAG: peptidylprolyl isomerase, partial [Ginsengibacter sp.]
VKADSIYNLLKHGADFATLAKEVSDDRTSYMAGGEMPEFGVGKYSPEFEEKAFSLQNDNDISKPFETSFGFHIIKRISATPISNSKNEEAFLYYLKNGVTNDKRIELAKNRFITSIIPKIGFQKNKVEVADMWKVSDSSLLNNKNIRSGKVDEQTILFTFNDKTSMKVDDWILFLRNSGKIVQGQMHQSYTGLWPEFTAFAAKENYRKRLSDFDPNFKAQIQEFEEGNMLFEIMERRVWGEAATDSVELVKYYKLHKDEYKWSPSADAILFSCVNENVANNLIQNLKARKNWRQLVTENNTLIQGDSARFELQEIPTVDRTNFTNDLITAPVVDKNDGTVVFAKIIKVYPANQPRSFEDARGLVISDYQNVLEKSWIEKIKKKYPVKINENVFQTLLK